MSGRAGSAVIVGRPNVGKSTLLNCILGEKLAIVSPRPQTTRNRLLGVKTWDGNQLAIVDTPGIHRRRANLNRFMVREALCSLQGADCVVLLTEVDARLPARGAPGLHPDDGYLLEQIAQHADPAGQPLIVAINKIDRVGDRRALLPLMAAWRERGYDTLVPISALRNDGIELLLAEIAARLPEGPPPYPADALTDRSERFLVGELIREQVFQRTGEEIPYAVAVEVQSFEERTERGDVVIEAAIHVERESQKAILIGKGGRQIKELGTHARAEVARLLGRPAHLKLTVHVEPNWTRSPAGRRKLGYEP